MIEKIIFLLVAAFGIGLFVWQIRKIRRNILLGQDKTPSDKPAERWRKVLLVAFGQQKMFKRPWTALLHLVIYVSFLVINLEVIEILIDGIFGTHRVFSVFTGFYTALMFVNEILAFLVIVACLAFLVRRNVMQVPRLHGVEMRAWPRLDANIILIVEIVLMLALFAFNTAGLKRAELVPGLELAGRYPISEGLINIFGQNPDPGMLLVIERTGWWVHIIGILAFMNYLPSSKHFHIIMAFPNVYYSKLGPKGKFTTNESITHEIKAMLDPGYQVPEASGEPQKFGAKDVEDLSRKQLMDAYTCTECGRCTSVCPANITGKLLSPRKIIMDTRDRMEEKGQSPLIFQPNDYRKEAERVKVTEEHTLLRGYITPEELWACTTCNACVESCPVNIDQLSTIMDLRRFLVLEESAAPSSLNTMFTNIENNGAPWAFSPAARLDWAEELFINE